MSPSKTRKKVKEVTPVLLTQTTTISDNQTGSFTETKKKRGRPAKSTAESIQVVEESKPIVELKKVKKSASEPKKKIAKLISTDKVKKTSKSVNASKKKQSKTLDKTTESEVVLDPELPKTTTNKTKVKSVKLAEKPTESNEPIVKKRGRPKKVIVA